MKFLALMRKELRESLPWMLLAAIFFLVFGGLAQRAMMPMYARFYFTTFSPGSNVATYQLTKPSLLQPVGTLLFLTSIALGLMLGGRQFWVAHFTKTWGFMLHRSVSRQTILAAKLTAAAVAFVICLGPVWLAFFWYACRLELLAAPPPTIRVFIEGWIYILLGFVVYLGTCLAGLSRVKWYTTKIFGLAFAVLILVTALAQWQPILAFAAIIAGILILLTQITDTFLNREF
ncbi:MAG TPA: hypothetical protein ENH34_01940 [Phycisphaerales bacterium]|nr:hypothetical protein [Phycisphaerales bacterium]